MDISPIVFIQSFWNCLSIFLNLLKIIIGIYGLMEWFVYEWENCKCEYPCFKKLYPKQPENLKILNNVLDLLYEVVKSNNYSRKRTNLMKNFTYFGNCIHCQWEMCQLELCNQKFFRINKFESLASRNRSNTPVLVTASVVIHLNKIQAKISNIRFIAYS